MPQTPPTLSPLVLNALKEQRERGWTLLQEDTLKAYVVISVEKGSVGISGNNIEVTLKAGDNGLLSPGNPYSVQTLSRTRYHFVEFALLHDREDIQPSPEEIWGFNLPILIAPSFAPRFQKEIPKIVLHTHLDTASRRLDACMLCGALVAEYAGWYEENRFRQLPKEALIEYAENVALKSLDARMDVSAFATAAGLAPSRFYEVYREIRGITPNTFLLRARMTKAREMLLNNWEIGNIAAILGYADSSTFGRVFRRFHGQTPSTWRRTQSRSNQ